MYLGDSKSHVNRTIEVYIKDKENEKIYNRADYFVSINRVYIPFEAKKDIGKGGGVLHQIRKYANITEFTKTEYDVVSEKLITKPISITNKPHGVVLLGDKNGIYLAYSDLNGRGYFVKRNGERLSWPCRITPDVIKDIKAHVSKMYELNDKFMSGNTTYSYNERNGFRQIEITYSLEHVKPPKPNNDYLIAALQPLRPYAGGNADLMNNVALLADSINANSKDICPVESLWLCTPMSNNVALYANRQSMVPRAHQLRRYTHHHRLQQIHLPREIQGTQQSHPY
jgi:hypothetical protein